MRGAGGLGLRIVLFIGGAIGFSGVGLRPAKPERFGQRGGALCRAFGEACAFVCLAASGACVPGDAGMVPGNGTPLMVMASADTPTIVVGAAVTLRAEVSGGAPPYLFRWDQNGGPADVALADATAASIMTPVLTVSGRYVFRVSVTDGAGRRETAFAAVEAGAALTVDLQTDMRALFEGTAATMTATVEGVNAPFTFAWELANGPVALDLSGETEAALTTAPLTTGGMYTFRVTARDSAGFEESDTVEISVDSAVSVSMPPLAVRGEPVGLTATVETPAEGVTLLWETLTGSAEFDDATSATPQITVTEGDTLEIRLTLFVPVEGQDAAEVVREVALVAVADLRPRVRVTTNFGAFVIELDGDAAPGHTVNFLRYVDEQFFDGLLFHRNACTPDSVTRECMAPFVLQGGGYQRVNGELVLKEPTHDPVVSESPNGLSNGTVYSVSLALSGSDRNSGTTQLFINLADNSFLDGQGFTVFGLVVEGRAVVDAIVAMETTDSPIIPGEVSLPVADVIMEAVRRVE